MPRGGYKNGARTERCHTVRANGVARIERGSVDDGGTIALIHELDVVGSHVSFVNVRYFHIAIWVQPYGSWRSTLSDYQMVLAASLILLR